MQVPNSAVRRVCRILQFDQCLHRLAVVAYGVGDVTSAPLGRPQCAHFRPNGLWYLSKNRCPQPGHGNLHTCQDAAKARIAHQTKISPCL
jgi:hypothetical protein